MIRHERGKILEEFNVHPLLKSSLNSIASDVQDLRDLIQEKDSRMENRLASLEQQLADTTSSMIRDLWNLIMHFVIR